MYREIITDPELGELELTHLVETYRELPVAQAEVYGYFDVDGSSEVKASREQAKKAFLEGEIRNPKLTYPQLEGAVIAEFLQTSERQVLDLMRQAVDLDHDQIRIRALEDLLRTAYLSIAILQLAGELQNPNISDEERTKKAELFNLANGEVYGYIKPELFFGLVDEENDRANSILNDGESSETVLRIAREYMELFKLPPGSTITPRFIPDIETVMDLKQTLEGEYADLLALVPYKNGNETLSLEEAAVLFEQAHAERMTGWSVHVVPGKSNIESRQSEKATLIGDKRKLLTGMKAVQLLLHENGIHVERRLRGDNLGDPLLSGIGLAGYGDIEEGLGVAMEEIYEGKTRDSGTQYYFALGMARGLDGTTRDFRDVFEIAWRREALREVKNGQISEEAIAKVRNKAYTQCVRIFRGTPCDIPGVVYTKDQAYFKGNQQAWELLGRMGKLPVEEQKTALSRLLAAKYDPTNEIHTQIVDQALSRVRKNG